MTDASLVRLADAKRVTWSPALTRGAFLLAVGGGVLAGLMTADAGETARSIAASGEELTRLLRLMALLKAAMALGVVAGVVWRLGSPVSFLRLAVYAFAGGAMGAGPALIWQMVHVGLGAFVLHGGLAAGIVVLWRDPACAARLSAAVAARCRTVNRD